MNTAVLGRFPFSAEILAEMVNEARAEMRCPDEWAESDGVRYKIKDNNRRRLAGGRLLASLVRINQEDEKRAMEKELAAEIAALRTEIESGRIENGATIAPQVPDSPKPNRDASADGPGAPATPPVVPQ